MGSLERRLEALESRATPAAHKEAQLEEACRRLTTDELRALVEADRRLDLKGNSWDAFPWSELTERELCAFERYEKTLKEVGYERD